MPEVERKTGLFIAVVAAAFVVAMAGWFLRARPAQHDPAAATHEEPAHDAGHGSATPRLELDQGRKWNTDAPLRQGMEGIRAAVAALGPGPLPDAEAARAAAAVREQVNFMISHCQLPPKADAVLHVLLVDILRGAAELEAAGTRDQGRATLLGALETYPQYFDHPGWH